MGIMLQSDQGGVLERRLFLVAELVLSAEVRGAGGITLVDLHDGTTVVHGTFGQIS